MEADRVVVELIANVDGFDAKVKQSTTAFETSVGKIGTAAQKAEAQVGVASTNIAKGLEKWNSADLKKVATSIQEFARGVGALPAAPLKAAGDGLDKVTKSAGSTRAAGMELAHVLRATSDQFAAGTPLSQIFATHVSQVGQAIGLAGVATAGWSIAIAGAVAVLSTFLFKTRDTRTEVDKLIDKMREQAQQAEAMVLANKIWEDSLEGVAQKARELADESERLIRTQKQLAFDDVKEAQDKLTKAEDQRTKSAKALTKARKEQADAERALAAAQARAEADPTAEAAGDVNDALNRAIRAREAVKGLAADYNTAEVAAGNASFAVKNFNIHAAEVKAEDLVDPIKAKFDALRDGAKETIRDVDKLAQRLADLDKKEKKAREKPKTDADLTPFLRPVSGSITGNFGDQRPGHTHAGVDIAVPVGTAVKAPAGGVIIEAGNVPGYGNVIYIDHGRGTISRLAHLSQIAVKKGQIIEAGQQIGLSGGARGAPGSGDSTGPHLHFEVRRNGRAVNPFKGPFPTDAGASAGAADRLAAAAERQAAQQRRNDEAFADKRDQLDQKILALKERQGDSIDEQLNLDLASIEAERASADRDALNGVTEGRLSEAQAKELLERNGIIENLQKQRVGVEAQVAKLQRADELEQRNLQYQIDDLQFSDEMATSRGDHLKLQHQIVDIVFQQRLAHLETLKNTALLNGKIQEAADIQAEINRAKVEQGQAHGRVDKANEGPLGKMAEDAANIDDQLEQIAANGLEDFVNGITDAITGTKSLKDAFSEMAQSIIKDLIQMIVKALIFKALQAALPGLFPTGHAEGGPVKKAVGGFIRGPGTSTSDSIPAMLSDGEYVMRAGAVRKLGLPFLNALNSGQVRHRAFGGDVRAIRPSNSPAAGLHGGGGVIVMQPLTLDLRGAVMTEDLLRHMNVIATTKAAQAGQAAYEASQKALPGAFSSFQKLGTVK